MTADAAQAFAVSILGPLASFERTQPKGAFSFQSEAPSTGNSRDFSADDLPERPCRSCGRPGRRGAWSTRPMADRRASLTDSSATKSGGRGRNMSSATGNRYLVGRMGGVRVLVRVNNRREGHLLPVPSAGVRTWLTQSLEHGRTAVAEREPPKLPHLRHIALCVRQVAA